MGHPINVRNRIVGSVAVAVFALVPIRRMADKRLQHEVMDISRSITAKVNKEVAVLAVRLWLKNYRVGTSMPGGAGLVVTPDAPVT